MGGGTPLSHTYAAAGSYTVTLVVTNGCGESRSAQRLAVAEPPRHRCYLPVIYEPPEFPRW